ncbi:alpha/beta fold hydrolase [Streptomyces sp. NPDC051219]|uniref:alpha/beta fold hydrolase n=1 Tax=Streptomyces sp. NPDC051219 TaxID=3155283 RepID=UPI0034364BE5
MPADQLPKQRPDKDEQRDRAQDDRERLAPQPTDVAVAELEGAAQLLLRHRAEDHPRGRAAARAARTPHHKGQPAKHILLAGGLALPSAGASTQGSEPRGFGSVSTAPNLPAGFKDTFTSQYIQPGGLRQHAVIGGDGPPHLLVHGWPENWYAWRLLMPELAKYFTVIAVDQRGIVLTDKPKDGYDTAALASDLVALMDALGHERFAVVGHDTGMIISHALAADHPEQVERVALAEVPAPPTDAEGLTSPVHR